MTYVIDVSIVCQFCGKFSKRERVQFKQDEDKNITVYQIKCKRCTAGNGQVILNKEKNSVLSWPVPGHTISLCLQDIIP